MMSPMEIVVIVVVAALVILLVRGLWRATAVQKGTGCPCCDKVLGGEHHHQAVDVGKEKAGAKGNDTKS